MAERVQKNKVNVQRDTEQVEQVKANVDTSHVEKTKADLDAMLDEIDEVLEENAEDMVRGYIQKGGQ